MFFDLQELVSIPANQALVFFWIKLITLFFEIPNLAKATIFVLEKIVLLFVAFQAFIPRGKYFATRI